ncbi:hypothetical protein OQA88_6122 [Cercophora sp. LCS_1]
MKISFLSVATATLCQFASIASAARVCGNGTSVFQHRIIEVRYDGADPARETKVATIAASLSNSGTPLYECVAQWPEDWAGWYQGGNEIIWSDCIWTGAGFGQDDTVSFAVDWKNKTIYLSHTFACSDKRGFEGIASGVLHADFECATQDGANFCFPSVTATGARPDLRISTHAGPSPLDATLSCAENTKRYQSWRVEGWKREFQMTPGTAAPDKPLPLDSGPTFTLRSVSNNATSSCTTVTRTNGVFEGACKIGKPLGWKQETSFTFDPKLNVLELSQLSACDDS